MDRFIAISIVIVLLIIGLIRIYRGVSRIVERTQSANEFLAKFATYFRSQGKDYETYAWLIKKSPRVQLEMGEFGYIANYSPPFSNYVISNYQIVVNIIPEIRNEFEDDVYLRNTRALKEYGALIQESLLRHLGSLSDSHEAEKKRLKNPIIWLTEGVSWVLLFPISFLNWVGIISETMIRKVAHNPLFKLIAGIFTILGALSTIMTIVVGWDSFLKTVEKLITP